jgi:hypothetical protein
VKGGKAMNKAQLQHKIDHLEFIHDQLEAEILYVDNLLKSVGFPQGLVSAKEVALELLEESEQEESQTENERENSL